MLRAFRDLRFLLDTASGAVALASFASCCCFALAQLWHIAIPAYRFYLLAGVPYAAGVFFEARQRSRRSGVVPCEKADRREN